MGLYDEKRLSCEEKIQNKIGLKDTPRVSVVYRDYQGRIDWIKIQRKKLRISAFGDPLKVLQPYEYVDPATFLNSPIQELQDSYLQLNHDRVRGEDNYSSHLIEVRVDLGERLILAAGHVWVFIGKLTNGDRFCAILSLLVRDIFKGCGLSSLLKLKEIALAKKAQCDFIQTYHIANNPYFLEAIAPSLKHGFVLYHGENRGGETYEEGGFIHLRKYLTRKARRNVAVEFTDGQKFMTSKENELILKHLELAGKTSGKAIATIEQYGD